ncbi:MAG TPA: cytochrome c peroxidase [Polyangiaceae bacterium]|nr:cytochrome c peroxidase [Polyangiaceae bacterium]
MSKRRRTNLGFVSLIAALAGACSLAACGSDDDSGGKAGSAGESGEAGESAGGSHAGSAGKSGSSNGGSAQAGSAGSGETGGSSAGNSSGGSSAGNSGSGNSGEGGSAGATPSEAGMGGEAGAATLPWTVAPELKALSPLPALPPDPTNKYVDNSGAAIFGQQLFFDKRYSGALTVQSDLGNVGDTGKVACASCHSGGAMSDGRDPFKVTVGTGTHTRNAPALVNSSFYEWTNWGGRFAAQWELPLAVAENAVTMASTRLKLAHFIYDNYKVPYETVFGTLPPALAANATDAGRFPASGKPGDATWTGMTAEDQDAVNLIIVNYGKAIQAYLRKLVSRNAPFDQYVASGGGNLSESAIRGAQLFVGKAQCTQCHSGPFFTDNKFHNLGGLGPDDGRFKDAGALKASALNIDGKFSDKVDTGRLANLTNPMTDLTTHSAFRTASLREVKDTAPYMHNGQLETLEDVVAFYNAGGGAVDAGSAAGTTKDPLLTPLGLSPTEQADLVEFLKTLSGEPVPSALTKPLP